MALSDAEVSRNVCFELLEGHSFKHTNSCITGFKPIISTENRYHKKKNVFAVAEPFVGEPWRQHGRVQLDLSSVPPLETLVLPEYLMSGHSQPLGLGAAVTWSTLNGARPQHGCWRATLSGLDLPGAVCPFLYVEAVPLAGRTMRSQPHTRSGLAVDWKGLLRVQDVLALKERQALVREACPCPGLGGL